MRALRDPLEDSELYRACIPRCLSAGDTLGHFFLTLPLAATQPMRILISSIDVSHLPIVGPQARTPNGDRLPTGKAEHLKVRLSRICSWS